MGSLSKGIWPCGRDFLAGSGSRDSGGLRCSLLGRGSSLGQNLSNSETEREANFNTTDHKFWNTFTFDLWRSEPRHICNRKCSSNRRKHIKPTENSQLQWQQQSEGFSVRGKLQSVGFSEEKPLQQLRIEWHFMYRVSRMGDKDMKTGKSPFSNNNNFWLIAFCQ